jgi:hypothetical protein
MSGTAEAKGGRAQFQDLPGLHTEFLASQGSIARPVSKQKQKQDRQKKFKEAFLFRDYKREEKKLSLTGCSGTNKKEREGGR